MTDIQRLGTSPRWSDVVIHAGTAQWVEVASDLSLDVRSQLQQIFQQVDDTLQQLGSSRTRLLQVLIFLADLQDAATLNELWDAWVPAGHAPVRACIGAALGSGCRAELVISAAVP